MNKGDKVYFTDPDEGISSGWYTLDDIHGDVYCLSNEHGEVEAFEHELSTDENAALIDMHTDWCATCGAEHSYMAGPCEKCGGKTFTKTRPNN